MKDTNRTVQIAYKRVSETTTVFITNFHIKLLNGFNCHFRDKWNGLREIDKKEKDPLNNLPAE